MKNAGRQNSVRFASLRYLQQVIKAPGAATGYDRDLHRRTDRRGQFDIVPILGAVGIHAGEKDLPCSSAFHFPRPFYGIKLCCTASTMSEDQPVIRFYPLRVNRDDNTLHAERFGRL